MAREARLPEQIVDIIPQHHGTRLMTYFYEKARKQAAAGSEVNDDDFRYPGPKPQTKEAAIFMLADGVEAAARTIEEPTPSRLKEMIHQIAGRIVLDGQFDAVRPDLRRPREDRAGVPPRRWSGCTTIASITRVRFRTGQVGPTRRRGPPVPRQRRSDGRRDRRETKRAKRVPRRRLRRS